MSELVLSCGDAAVRVVPHNGGRLSSLAIGDLEVLGSGGTGLLDWGCYPMAPYAGRVRGGRLDWAGRRHQLALLSGPNAIHGVTLDRPWEVTEVSATGALLRCGFDRRWPLGGHAEQRVELSADHLTITVSVHAGAEPMPAWCGLHPWFRRRLDRGGEAVLGLRSAGMLERGADGLPTGAVVAAPAGPYDDCFVEVDWPVTLTWPGALTLAVRADAGYVVVFDGKDSAVCVEPQTAPPDAARLGLAAVVEPGTPLTLTTTWTWS